ncbi:MAG: PIN domain-containing protein [Methylovulum sp.]|uniref:PIN domain-containing protein n=1 Tax=Methylovulum sp. TaxID=1916980 RepID=UPI002611BED7|nr:PIN domain-containing protein [Methylovulum sp.]MDD2722678.1 PIN domain-containing protein [Methylovulum sp.]MDD5126313.1 PIN domain-containing protein [Methylovulum sp.]
MPILIDTSIWIDYFKNGANSDELDGLLENNQIVLNDIILAELLPFLIIKKQYKIIELLKEISLLALQINWPEIIQWQTTCLTAGFNGIGIPDLLIAQNSKQNNCKIYSLDKHFRFLNQCDDTIRLFA